MATDKLVVWDPKDDYWEGSLIDDMQASIIRARGGAILPVTPSLFSVSGCGGFFKRAWGAGWPLDFAAPRMVCPLTLFVDQSLRRLHWIVRLAPDPRHLEKAREGKHSAEGNFRIVGDSSQGHSHITTVTPDTKAHDARDLGRCDDFDGWCVGGSATIHPSADGYYGFGIYGAMPGVRVVWAAVSLTAT